MVKTGLSVMRNTNNAYVGCMGLFPQLGAANMQILQWLIHCLSSKAYSTTCTSKAHQQHTHTSAGPVRQGGWPPPLPPCLTCNRCSRPPA